MIWLLSTHIRGQQQSNLDNFPSKNKIIMSSHYSSKTKHNTHNENRRDLTINCCESNLYHSLQEPLVFSTLELLLITSISPYAAMFSTVTLLTVSTVMAPESSFSVFCPHTKGSHQTHTHTPERQADIPTKPERTNTPTRSAHKDVYSCAL